MGKETWCVCVSVGCYAEKGLGPSLGGQTGKFNMRWEALSHMERPAVKEM